MPRPYAERYVRNAWHRRRLEIALGVVQLFGLITSVVISRRFGPTGRGTLTEVTIWVQVLGFGATMSLDKALVVTSRSASSATARQEITAYVLRRAFTYALIVAGGGVLLIGHAIWRDPVLWLALGIGCVASTANEVTMGFLLMDYHEPRYIRCRLVQPALLMTGTAVVAFYPHHRTVSFNVALVACSCRRLWPQCR